MSDLVKRPWLGTLLIAAACAVLLVADLNRRTAGPAAMPRVAVIQHANTPPLDEGIRGLGIHLMRTTMDDFEYTRVNGQNLLTLRKRVAGVGPDTVA